MARRRVLTAGRRRAVPLSLWQLFLMTARGGCRRRTRSGGAQRRPPTTSSEFVAPWSDDLGAARVPAASRYRSCSSPLHGVGIASSQDTTARAGTGPLNQAPVRKARQAAEGASARQPGTMRGLKGGNGAIRPAIQHPGSARPPAPFLADPRGSRRTHHCVRCAPPTGRRTRGRRLRSGAEPHPLASGRQSTTTRDRAPSSRGQPSSGVTLSVVRHLGARAPKTRPRFANDASTDRQIYGALSASPAASRHSQARELGSDHPVVGPLPDITSCHRPLRLTQYTQS